MSDIKKLYGVWFYRLGTQECSECKRIGSTYAMSKTSSTPLCKQCLNPHKLQRFEQSIKDVLKPYFDYDKSTVEFNVAISLWDQLDLLLDTWRAAQSIDMGKIIEEVNSGLQKG